MKKKVLSVLICLALTAALCGCSGEGTGSISEGASRPSSQSGRSEASTAPKSSVAVESVDSKPEETSAPAPLGEVDWSTVPDSPEADFKTAEIEGGVRIKSYDGEDHAVKIPAQIGGKPVLEVNFSVNSAVTDVYIPEGVVKLGNVAFNSCKNLKSIVIPNTVTMIDKYALSNISLTSVTVPDSVTVIEEGGISSDYELTELIIGKNVTEIGKDAFSFNKKLEEIVLPEGLKTLGNEAFEKCDALKSIVIPDGVTIIGSKMFLDCISLEKADIGSGIKIIDEYAFNRCKSLKEINIPNGVTEIRGNAFRECDELSSVTIPDSVTSIGKYAFLDCPKLSAAYKGETYNYDRVEELYKAING